METNKMYVPTMAELTAEGKKPDVLFWVGCAGSYDERAKKITRAFVKILNAANVNFAVLGTEESCSGDPAKRAGNEFLFQMQAMTNIEIMNAYEVEKVVTACPHCYNTIKNEYSKLGGNYEVVHHTEMLQQLINDKKLTIEEGEYTGKKITFHDPCYLGRANDVYEAPRSLINEMEGELLEMASCKADAMCCGAGGAQMFKEAEKGDKEVFIERIEDALETKADIIVTACPYCMVMMTDGLKYKNKEEELKNYDIAELIEQTLKL
ncbi:MAG: (Fe-S)-binding protein [Ichthyobacteriaceae bacterium]|nr:(Fe-S)-binding protein [Ichthyobacteriaceae bacterium]